MNKQEFLDALRIELSFLPEDEAQDAIAYYDEYISDSEDEQKAIEELGSPKRVAEDLKKDCGEKSSGNTPLPAVKYEQGTKYPTWLIVLIVIIAIGLGLPIISFAGSLISALLPAAVLILIAALLIKVIGDKNNSPAGTSYQSGAYSDIKSLQIKLGGGSFLIQRGAGFDISGRNFRSEIIGGVWHISGSSTSIGQKHKPPTAESMVIITVPESFTAESAKISLGAGNLLIKDLAANDMTVEVSLGNVDAKKLYSKNLTMRCGVGRIAAAASMHGNVSIQCGMGDAALKLTNKSDEYNISTKAALGKVSVNSGIMHDGYIHNANASYSMEIKCGMGNVTVEFGEAAE